MTTNNATHPADLLEPFALDALEPDEEQTVLDHLEDCQQCAAVIDGHLQTAAALAYTAPAHAPPERVRTRLLASVELLPPGETPPPPQKVSVSHRRRPPSWNGIYSVLGSRWGRLLMPVTAVAAIALVAFVITLNVQMSSQMTEMEAENVQLRQAMGQNQATATARLAQASDTVTQMQGSLQFLQNTLAQPGNQSLVMNPMQPNSPSRGVLVLSGDGSTGVIMASNLNPLNSDSAYQVWLTQGAEKIQAGDMDIDERGWGTLALDPNTPLTQFDSVQLTHGPLAQTNPPTPTNTILETPLP